jgi:hypothetical protein
MAMSGQTVWFIAIFNTERFRERAEMAQGFIVTKDSKGADVVGYMWPSSRFPAFRFSATVLAKTLRIRPLAFLP